MDCDVIFEITTQKDLDISQIWCVDCGSHEVVLTDFDSDFSNRIAQLVLDIEEIKDRVEQLEWYADDDKPISTSDKKNTSFKN